MPRIIIYPNNEKTAPIFIICRVRFERAWLLIILIVSANRSFLERLAREVRHGQQSFDRDRQPTSDDADLYKVMLMILQNEQKGEIQKLRFLPWLPSS